MPNSCVFFGIVLTRILFLYLGINVHFYHFMCMLSVSLDIYVLVVGPPNHSTVCLHIRVPVVVVDDYMYMYHDAGCVS